MSEAPVSLRELSRELGLDEPEDAILQDALAGLVNDWPLSREVLRAALARALESDWAGERDRLEQEKRSAWRHAREMETDWARERDRAEIAERERDEALAALRPLTAAADAFEGYDDGHELASGWQRVTVGHLRQARTVLDHYGGGGG